MFRGLWRFLLGGLFWVVLLSIPLKERPIYDHVRGFMLQNKEVRNIQKNVVRLAQKVYDSLIVAVRERWDKE